MPNDLIWSVVARRRVLSSLHSPSTWINLVHSGKWYFFLLSFFTYLWLSSKPCRILTEYSTISSLLYQPLADIMLIIIYVYFFHSFLFLPSKDAVLFFFFFVWFLGRSWGTWKFRKVVFYACHHSAPSLTWRMHCPSEEKQHKFLYQVPSLRRK